MLVTLCVIWISPILTHQQQFDLPGNSLFSYQDLQVDGEGRAFVAAGNQLLRLSSSLVMEQNVILSSRAVKISLSPGGEKLLVCTADISCVMYNAGDLSAQPLVTDVTLASAGNMALFSSGSSFFTGSSERTISLSRIYNTSRTAYSEHSKNYTITSYDFQRKFVFGFYSGNYSYFIVLDSGLDGSIRIMRSCHDPSCCSDGDGSCSFTALYEEVLFCGNEFNSFIEADDGICGVSVVEDFGGKNGASVFLSRCHHAAQSGRNMVCSISVADIDAMMDGTYALCSSGLQYSSGTAWGAEKECPKRTVRSTKS